MKSPHTCPGCGSQASAFAAGCSFCGAALDPGRARGKLTLGQRTRSAWLARPHLLPRIPVTPRRPRGGS